MPARVIIIISPPPGAHRSVYNYIYDVYGPDIEAPLYPVYCGGATRGTGAPSELVIHLVYTTIPFLRVAHATPPQFPTGPHTRL